MVTNHHVVAGTQSVVLLTRSGEELSAEVIASDAVLDVVLLKVEDAGRLPPALPLASSSARLGSSVFTIGFPRVDVMGKTPKLSAGIVSGVNGLYDNPDSYQISVPIQPGNSGGPLLNMHGEAVGVITAMLGRVDSAGGDPEPMPGINYALKIQAIRALLEGMPARGRRIPELARGGDSLEALADKIQGSVLIVRAR